MYQGTGQPFELVAYTAQAGGGPAAPANDMFASAQGLSGASGSVSGSNVGATKEAGEPDHAGSPGGGSVWFAWTAPAGGAVTVDTAGSGFDTLLAVYTGSSVGSLSRVAANDDADATVRTSRVSFTATAGTTYRIAVDGYRHVSTGRLETGPISLRWGS